MPQFKQNFNMFYNKGKLISHKGKNHFLTKDELFYSYMSMTVLQFFYTKRCYSRNKISFEQMTILELNMHTGNDIKASKIEAIYFPSRSKSIFWIKNHESYLLPLKPPPPLNLTNKLRKPY